MPARILAGPLLLLAIFFGYLAYEYNERFTLGLIVAVIFLVLSYVFAPQINWWWWMRHPPDLDPRLHPLLDRIPFYSRLSEGDRRIFRKRVFLFNQAQVFMPQAIQEVTDDVKTAISAAAMQVNFHRRVFLYPDYENIVVYAHPFPSPQFPNHPHASEIFQDEHGNGLIFSIEHVMRSFMEPYAYYNIGIHEYAKLLIKTSTELDFPELNDADWPALEQISGFPHHKLVDYIGLEEIDPLPVAIAHYLVFRERFRAILPDVAEQLDLIFSGKPA